MGAQVVSLVLMAAALLTVGDVARAENECGTPEPGKELVCSPSNYDPDTDGNIFYGPDEANEGDFTIRLTEGLSINYDRNNSGDDVYVPPEDPDNPRYSAVWVTPTESGSGYTGDISLYSSADVTSNGRGISVGHYGESGALHMELTGGTITTTGPSSWAVHGYHEGEGALNVDVRGSAISTTGESTRGILGAHDGTGDVNIGGHNLTVSAAGDLSSGIRGQHTGQGGDIDINLQGSAISTTGESSTGIYGLHTSVGDLGVVARNLSIVTKSDGGEGIFGVHLGEGDVDIDARGLTVSAEGDRVDGIRGLHRGQGDLDIHLQDSAIEMMGTVAPGIITFHLGEGDINVSAQGGSFTGNGVLTPLVYAEHRGKGDNNVVIGDVVVTTEGSSTNSIEIRHRGEGDINLSTHGGSITVNARESSGVSTQHFGKGDNNIDLRDVAVVTAGSLTDGIAARHDGDGDIAVDVVRGRITTRGAYSDGIFSYQLNPTDDMDDPLIDPDGNVVQVTGDIAIDMAGGMINTEGRGSHGIHALHESGSGEIRIAVDGGSIHAPGTDASGIRVGRLGEDGSVVSAAGMGEDGYRRQTVSVNAPVTGGAGENAAGVFLAGGGRVIIGPRGTVGAASGVAIRAAGEAPRLHVDLDLAGRRVGTVLQEGEIINDGGVTTLLVNDVLLHDEATGATGRTVLNGAWDLTLRASDTVAGRDFSARDFSETYAPRAAVYEALPGLLLRLHSRGPAGERLTAPGSPAWIRVAGGGGRYTPVQASVGAEYDFRRLEVEAGLDMELGPRLTGTLSVRHVYGWGDVSSPTGGGEINARGLGGAVGLAWTGPQGYYFRGRISVMDYDVDLTADRRGTLMKEASAVGHSLGFETGRRFTLSERLKLTPRVWVTRSKIDLGFTDAVQSRLWAEDSDRLTAGTGLVAETACSWDDGAQAFAVRGSLDLWRTLGDGTAVNVSQGAPLKSVSDKTRMLLSLGGVYRWGRFSVSSEVAAGGPGSRDQEYAGFLNLGVQF